MNITREQILAWLNACAETYTTHREVLTDLDIAIGDGDHGINMHRGFAKVAEKLSASVDETIHTVLKTVGMTLLSSVGGASGPLYGTFFLKAAETTKNKSTLTLADLAALVTAGTKGLIDRGHAQKGDKTMCDVWLPVRDCLTTAVDSGQSPDEALRTAAVCAVEAAEATIPMQAKKGRASYLNARSIGHKDPGAASSALMVQALVAVITGS